MVEVTEIDGGLQAKVRATIEVKEAPKPAVVADCLIRVYG
jgi:hypothetical protein